MVTPSENKAMVLRRVDDMSFEARPITSALPAGECLIRVKACGICGSDVHYLKNGRIGDFVSCKICYMNQLCLLLGCEVAYGDWT